MTKKSLNEKYKTNEKYGKNGNIYKGVPISSPMIVKCPTCGADKRTYSKKFHHCGVSHVSVDNLYYKGNEQTHLPTAKNKKLVAKIQEEERVATPTSDAKTPLLSPQKEAEKQEAVHEEPQKEKTPSETPLNASNEVIGEELEPEGNDSPESIDVSQYDHYCSECGAYFMEKLFKEKNYCCPNCAYDWSTQMNQPETLREVRE